MICIGGGFSIIQRVSEKILPFVYFLCQNKDFNSSFIVDDAAALTTAPHKLILREQNRNYLRVGKNLVEIITRDDAKFLYLEGRIKKFALLEPTNAEFEELKNFYEANQEDVLIFNR